MNRNVLVVVLALAAIGVPRLHAQGHPLRGVLPPGDSLGVPARVEFDAAVGRWWARAYRLRGGLLVATAAAFSDSASARDEIAKLRGGEVQFLVDSLVRRFLGTAITVTGSQLLELRLGDAAVGVDAMLDIDGQATRGLQIMIARGRLVGAIMIVTGVEALTRERLIDLARAIDARMVALGDVDPIAVVAERPPAPPSPPVAAMPAMPDLTQLAADAVVDSGVYSQAAVDRVPVLLQAALEYPPELRQAGRQGWVVLRFVVGGDGRPEPESILVLAVSDSAFVPAARATIEKAVYRPGEVDSVAVRVLVVQPVTFQLQREPSPPE